MHECVRGCFSAAVSVLSCVGCNVPFGMTFDAHHEPRGYMIKQVLLAGALMPGASGSALIGAKVHNAAKETVGSIDDDYLDESGTVNSVGGYLGAGTNDVKGGRDGWTRDSLRAWPDYKYERRNPRVRAADRA